MKQEMEFLSSAWNERLLSLCPRILQISKVKGHCIPTLTRLCRPCCQARILQPDCSYYIRAKSKKTQKNNDGMSTKRLYQKPGQCNQLITGRASSRRERLTIWLRTRMFESSAAAQHLWTADKILHC